MKKILKTLLITSLLVPSIAFGTITASWNATSTDIGFIAPNLINGNAPYLSFTFASTTATSTMKGINLPYGGCFAISGTCIGSGGGSSSVGPINTLQASDGAGGFIATGTPQLMVGNILATSSADNIFRGPVRLPNGLVNGLLKLTGATNLISNAVLGTDYVSGSGTSGNCVKWNASNALGDFGAPCSSGGGGTGTVSTSTVPTIGNLAYWTSNGYPSLLGSVATSALAVGSSLSSSGTLGYQIGGTNSSLSINTANTNTWSVLQNFNYSSSTVYSTFQTSSTTVGFFGTLNIPNLGIPAGSFLAVDPTGKVIATTTPTGGGLSSYDAWTHSTIFTPNSATTTKISIGTTTPYYSFTVASSTGPQIALSDGTSGVSQWTMRNAGGNLYFASTTIQGNATTTTSAISIIGSTGYIGIGSTTPFGTFSIDSSATSLTRPMFIIGSSAGLNYSVSTSSFAQSLIGTSTNLVVNATEVIVATTSPQIALQGNPGETPWYFRSIGNNFYLATSSPTSSATSTNAIFGFLSTGVMQLGNYANCNGTNSALGITSGQLLCDSLVSDQRLKKNITPLSNGLSTVLSLKPITFDWKDLANHNTSDPREQYGFIAQDVMKILPSAVGTTTPQPGTNGAPAYTLDKTMIIAPIVDAIHSMWKSITDLIAWNNDQDKSLKVLEDQNAAQQKQIDALQTQINNLKK